MDLFKTTSNVLHVQQRGHLKKSYRFDYINNYFELTEKSSDASSSGSKEDQRHSQGATMIEKTVEHLSVQENTACVLWCPVEM